MTLQSVVKYVYLILKGILLSAIGVILLSEAPMYSYGVFLALMANFAKLTGNEAVAKSFNEVATLFICTVFLLSKIISYFPWLPSLLFDFITSFL